MLLDHWIESAGEGWMGPSPVLGYPHCGPVRMVSQSSQTPVPGTHLGRQRFLGVLLGLTAAALVGSAPIASAELRMHLEDPDVAARARALPLGARLVLEGAPLDTVVDSISLERFRVFAEDALLLAQDAEGEHELPRPPLAYFRGQVGADPFSFAFLSIDDHGELRGVLRFAGEVFVLGSEGSGEQLRPLLQRLSPTRSSGPSSEPWSCDNEWLVAPPPTLESLVAPLQGFAGAASATVFAAQVAVETDAELLALFGGSTAAATAYIGDLMGAISAIYRRDLDTDLEVSYLKLWTGGTAVDPWQATNPGDALAEVGNYWHANNAGVARSTVHFMSGKNTNAGIAWVGVLCQEDFLYCAAVNPAGACVAYAWGGAYGVTMGIDGNFNPGNPQVVWDIVAVSHEIGHNFNSPHTHCYMNIPYSQAPPVDNCYNAQSGANCYSGRTVSIPADGGSIMSYCHLYWGMGAINLYFGAPGQFGTESERVPERMRAHVESRAASYPQCLPEAVPCTFDPDLELTNRSVSGTESFAACNSITAGPSFTVTGSGRATFRAGEKIVLRDGFSVGSGASFTAIIDPAL